MTWDEQFIISFFSLNIIMDVCCISYMTKSLFKLTTLQFALVSKKIKCLTSITNIKWITHNLFFHFFSHTNNIYFILYFSFISSLFSIQSKLKVDSLSCCGLCGGKQGRGVFQAGHWLLQLEDVYISLPRYLHSFLPRSESMCWCTNY